MTGSISLKSGRDVSTPCLFANPFSGPDGGLLRGFLQGNNVGEKNHTPVPGAENLNDFKVFEGALTRHDVKAFDGVVVNLENWGAVKGDLELRQQTLSTSSATRPIDEQVLIVNPSTAPLFGYGQRKSGGLASFEPFPNNLSTVLDKIAERERGEKWETRQKDLYPTINNTNTVQKLLNFQIKAGADIIGSPALPISRKGDFDFQLEKVREVFSKTTALIDVPMADVDRDLMLSLAIKPSVLETPDNESRVRGERVAELISGHSPDFVGVEILTFNRDEQTWNQEFLDMLEEINKRIDVPIILFNCREFGYVSLVYGVDILSMPIAQPPLPPIIGGGGSSSDGRYYHREHMLDIPRSTLRDETRDKDYKFPCYCAACQSFSRIDEVDEWSTFRRVHFLLTKDDEMRHFRNTDKPLRNVLHSKFTDSKKTDYVTYLN